MKNMVENTDMCLQAIKEGLLTKGHEDEIKKILMQKNHVQGCRCLIECMAGDLEKDAGMEVRGMVEMHDRIYGCCNGQNNIDDASFYEILKKHGIKMPYEGEDLEMIRAWMKQNPEDVRGLALALWLEGEISPEEIINLKITDLVNDGSKYMGDVAGIRIRKHGSEDYLLLTANRKKIIHAALGLYQEKGKEYVFMTESKGRLEKLPKSGLPIKLSKICRQIGVEYKARFKCTDRILWRL